MNRGELRRALVEAGINESMYSLDGPSSQSESYSLVEKAGEWQVLYKERGEFTQLGSYSTEEAACTKILELFSDVFGARIGSIIS